MAVVVDVVATVVNTTTPPSSASADLGRNEGGTGSVVSRPDELQ